MDLFNEKLMFSYKGLETGSILGIMARFQVASAGQEIDLSDVEQNLTEVACLKLSRFFEEQNPHQVAHSDSSYALNMARVAIQKKKLEEDMLLDTPLIPYLAPVK